VGVFLSLKQLQWWDGKGTCFLPLDIHKNSAEVYLKLLEESYVQSRIRISGI